MPARAPDFLSETRGEPPAEGAVPEAGDGAHWPVAAPDREDAELFAEDMPENQPDAPLARGTRRRRRAIDAGGLLGILLLAGLFAMLYGAGGRDAATSDPPPVVEAGPGPVKTQAKIDDRLLQAAPAEQAQAPESSVPIPASYPAGPGPVTIEIAAPPGVEAVVIEPDPAPAAEAAPAPPEAEAKPALDKPVPVKTFVVLSDGTVMRSADAPPEPEIAAADAAAEPAPVAPPVAEAPSPAEAASPAEVASLVEAPAPAEAPSPAEAAAETAAPQEAAPDLPAPAPPVRKAAATRPAPDPALVPLPTRRPDIPPVRSAARPEAPRPQWQQEVFAR